MMKANKTKLVAAMLTSILLAGTLAGCSTGSQTDSTTTQSTTATEQSVAIESLICDVSQLDLSAMFTDRDKDPSFSMSGAHTITFHGGSEITCSDRNGLSVAEDGSHTVTITAEGVYIVSGETDDFEIIVDVEDTEKVQIVFNGVTMVNDDGPCIFVKNADKVFLTLAEGTVNTLSDTGDAYVQPDEGSTVDGVIFARDDLCTQGEGTLIVNASYMNGIVGKDDLKITGGTITITAANKGIQANDSIRIADGVITVTAEDDTIHTDTEDKEQKGYVYIAGGTLTLTSGDDGIHAATALIVTGGTIDVTQSYEGLEGDTIDIIGGTIKVKASDDGLNATGTGSTEDTLADQETEGILPRGFDESDLPDDLDMETLQEMFENGEFPSDAEPPQGTDAEPVEPPEAPGEPPVPPTGTDAEPVDDAQGPPEPLAGTDAEPVEAPGQPPEAPGEPPQGDRGGGRPGGFGGGQPGGGFGGMMGDADETAYIRISGGTIYVDADGDGIDSNGYLFMNGGMLAVDGPTSDGDGALDVGIAAYVSGGICVAAGSSGMAETFEDDSAQYSVRYYFSSTRSAGTTLTLTDESGTEILSYTPAKNFSSIVISSPDLTAASYTITAGDSTETFTLDAISTTVGTGARGGWWH